MHLADERNPRGAAAFDRDIYETVDKPLAAFRVVTVLFRSVAMPLEAALVALDAIPGSRLTIAEDDR